MWMNHEQAHPNSSCQQVNLASDSVKQDMRNGPIYACTHCFKKAVATHVSSLLMSSPPGLTFTAFLSSSVLRKLHKFSPQSYNVSNWRSPTYRNVQRADCFLLACQRCSHIVNLQGPEAFTIPLQRCLCRSIQRGEENDRAANLACHFWLSL